MPALLAAEQWAEADSVVVREFRAVPTLNTILARAELVTTFDDVGVAYLERQMVGNLGEAAIHCDERLFAMQSIPLPMTHADVEWDGFEFESFLELLAKRTRSCAATVEAELIRKLPADPRPANFRLIVGLKPTLVQMDLPRKNQFKVLCVIVPDNRGAAPAQPADKPIMMGSKPC